MTVISTGFAPDDSELDTELEAMEMDLLAADCDIVIPEDVEDVEVAEAPPASGASRSAGSA